MRRTALVLSALLVAGAALAAAAPAQASGGNAIARLAASSSVVTPGGHVVLRGSIARSELAASSHRVTVQQRTTGTSVWRTWRHVTVTSTGTVRVTSSALRTSHQFRLALSTARGTVHSVVAAVTVPTSVTVTATSPRTPTAGDAVVLAGTTSSQLAGRRIFLQLQVGSTWRSVASSQVFADAAFNVHGIATAGGDRVYRAYVASSAGRAAAASDPVDFTVYAWYRVADLAAASVPTGDGALTEGLLSISGTRYEQSWGAVLAEGGSASVAVPLGNRCVTFRATLGAAAGSDAGFDGRWRLFADDDVALDTEIGDGSTRLATADITGAATLRMRSFSLAGAGDPAWGNAEVLCAGHP